MGIQQQIQKREKVLGGMKKGGPIKKTGLYMLHKGEVVVPANVVKGTKKKEMK